MNRLEGRPCAVVGQLPHEDHLYLISAEEITRSARQWLISQLDSGQRGHVIFMDRDEFLDHSARILLDLRLEGERNAYESTFDVRRGPASQARTPEGTPDPLATPCR